MTITAFSIAKHVKKTAHDLTFNYTHCQTNLYIQIKPKIQNPSTKLKKKNKKKASTRRGRNSLLPHATIWDFFFPFFTSAEIQRILFCIAAIAMVIIEEDSSSYDWYGWFYFFFLFLYKFKYLLRLYGGVGGCGPPCGRGRRRAVRIYPVEPAFEGSSVRWWSANTSLGHLTRRASRLVGRPWPFEFPQMASVLPMLLVFLYSSRRYEGGSHLLFFFFATTDTTIACERERDL